MAHCHWSCVLGIAVLLSAGGSLRADQDDVRKMQRACAAARISLTQAIEIAEREVAGGRAVDVELEWKRNGPRIEVELVVADAWKEVHIDAVTGKVLKVQDEPADDREDQEELKRDKENLQAATIGFGEAIAQAEKEAGGKVVEVELTSSAGQPAYKLKLLVNDKLVTRRVRAVKDDPQP